MTLDPETHRYNRGIHAQSRVHDAALYRCGIRFDGVVG
jgi:hypothetical protein